MENILFTTLALILFVLALFIVIYIIIKQRKTYIKGLEEKIGTKFKPSLLGYKAYYKNYEVLLFLKYQNNQMETRIRIKHGKNIPFVITNYSKLDVLFEKMKFFYKKVKLPFDNKGYEVMAKDIDKAKKILYSHQEIFEEIEKFIPILEISKGKFYMEKEFLELKFPDIRLITKSIIDKSLNIIKKL